MAKGEVVIAEDLCKGCGYCTVSCPHDCIYISDKYSAQGHLLAAFSNADSKCNACGMCGWLCPHFAIEVYKYVD